MTLEADPELLRIKRGRAFSETWAYADDTSGTDVRADLTGATGTFKVFASSSTEAIEGTFTIGTNGEVTLGLTEEQVAELDGIRAGHWETVLTDSLGVPHDATGPIWMEDAA